MFYQQYSVEEYYVYAPDRIELEGWCRSEDGLLEQIEPMAGWVSPRLGIRFEMGEELELYRPDGAAFSSFAEVNQSVAQERQRAEQERQRAEQAEQIAQQERQRSQQLEERLRSLGIDPDTL